MRKALPLSAVVSAHLVDERVLVCGKVLVHGERVAQRDQRDEIGGLHFGFEEGLGRFHTALQILWLHGSEVEEHHDEPVIAQLLGLGHNHRLAARGAGGEAAHRGLLERRGHVDALEIKSRDLLLFAVFVDSEVALLEVFDDLAGFDVARHHVGEDEFGIGLEHESALRRCRDLAGRLRGKRRHTGSG